METNDNIRTFVFPDKGANCLDPNLLLGMNGGGFGNGMNNPFWAIILLAFLRQWGFDGFGNGNGCNCLTQNQLSAIQETLNTNQGNTLLMNAITGNGGAIKDLATALNCDINAVQAGINGIQSAICNLGSKTDMNSMQIVNAINSGNTNIATQLSQCCCDLKQIATNQGYENRIATLNQTNVMQNGFAQSNYIAAENACAIKQNATDNTSRVLAKLDAIEDSRKDREIASLTAALTAANSRAERQAELAPIYQSLADIKCKQADTITIPYSPVTPVPTCVAYNALYNGCGYPYANRQQGAIWS